MSKQVNYPKIAANIFDEQSGKRSFEPYLIKGFNGLKVGLLGFTDPDVPARQPPHMSARMKFEAATVLQPLLTVSA